MMKKPRQKRAAKPAFCFRLTPISPMSRCRGRAMTLNRGSAKYQSGEEYRIECVHLLRRSHAMSTAVE